MAAAPPTVTKSPPSLVPPAGPTPGGSLPLSSIDKTAAVRVSVDFIQVFPAPTSGKEEDRSPSSAIAAMREGFAKALVPYYPVAGRIAEPVPGEPEIECTGEGVWFVEAEASCSLEEARNLERPLCIPKEELLPRPPAGVRVEDTLLLAQVSPIPIPCCFSPLTSDHFG